jgi:acetyl-CoA acyltransferase
MMDFSSLIAPLTAMVVNAAMALAAIAAGEFKAEMTPVEVVERFPDLATGQPGMKTRTVSVDEGPRADTSLEGLGKLKPVFAAKGSVTAGNSSQESGGTGLQQRRTFRRHGALCRQNHHPTRCIHHG